VARSLAVSSANRLVPPPSKPYPPPYDPRHVPNSSRFDGDITGPRAESRIERGSKFGYAPSRIWRSCVDRLGRVAARARTAA
jgi:hypothetical protein